MDAFGYFFSSKQTNTVIYFVYEIVMVDYQCEVEY